MATFYLDPENGNDALDGLSFANRWKTLTTGATAARTAAGDTIRLIASPDPASLGAAQWTDGSTVITPTTSRNKLIDECESGWVGATNVTVTHNTASSVTKTAPATLNVAALTAFTTGKVAYKTLPATLDLSTYQQISLWAFANSPTGWDNVTLHLCSDTTGDVPLASIALGDIGVSSSWEAMVLNNGAPLPAGVNSISVSTSSDPSTLTLRLQNIVACKAPGPDAITLWTLIGKQTVGEPEWYPLNRISDTELYLGAANSALYAQDPVRPYKGTTESVTTYKRDCIPAWNSSQNNLGEGGTEAAPLVISGGWNRTDMSTQTGETWLTGQHRIGTFIACNYTVEFVNLSKMGLAHFVNTAFNELHHGWNADLLGVLACDKAFAADAIVYQPNWASLKCAQVWGCNDRVFASFSRPADIEIGRIHGCVDTATGVQKIAGPQFAGVNGKPSRLKIGKIDNNAGTFFGLGYVPLHIVGAVIQDNDYDLYPDLTTFGSLHLENCTIPAGMTLSSSNNDQAYKITETCIAGDPRRYRTTINLGVWESDQTTVHTAGGVSLAVKPKSTRWCEFFPLAAPVAKIAVQANKLVTVKAWVRRDNAGLTAGLMIEDSLAGTVKTRVPMTAAANTWEEVTLTFTPTLAGVVEIFGYAFGGSTYTAYFADPTFTQAD